ncbi:Uncharacterised protein [uncultured archaeon]|nr:Uncharacterised protein [uncultured archaeon]
MIGDYCKTLLFSPTQIPNVVGGSWMHLVFLGLLFSTGLVVLLYMLSRALRIPRLEGWTRHELFQILATAGLAVLAAGLLYQMCTFNIAFLSADLYQGANGADLMHSYCPQSATFINGRAVVTPYCAAEAYLHKIENRGQILFTSLIGINGAMSYLFRITWESRPLGIGYTLEPLAGLQQIQNVFLVGVSGFLVAYLSVIIQMRILDYIVAAVPFYFMPLGLLLRCFPPTRQFGGALIGFSFASLLLFPLILVVNDVILYTSLQDVTTPRDSAGNPIDLNAMLYGSNPQIGAPMPVQDLSKLKTGSTYPGFGQIGRILYQKPDLLIFQPSTSAPDYYFARRETNRTSDQIVLYKMAGTFSPSSAGAAINERWGMYNNQPNSSGSWTVQTNSRGTPVQYFTDPDPGAPDKQLGLTSSALTTALLWPAQMVMVFSVAAVLMPIINFMVYIEIARSLTRVVGAEMDLSNLTRMI